MALTITIVSKPYALADRWQTVNKVVLDNAYPTGGYALKATDLGLGNAARTDPELAIEVDNSNGYGATYDFTNEKLLFYTPAGTQVSNGADLSAVTTLRVKATSKYRG